MRQDRYLAARSERLFASNQFCNQHESDCQRPFRLLGHVSFVCGNSSST
jgi:hypothetical protein